MKSYWTKVWQRRIARRRALALTGAGVAGAALLAACGGGDGDEGGDGDGDKSGLLTTPQDTSKQAKRGGTVKWWAGAEPASLDFHLGLNPLNVFHQMVNGCLVNEKAGLGKPPTYEEVIPDLAESWEWSADRLQLTFKLRQGVKWHNKAPVNGRLFDADDILFSWDRFTRAPGSDRGSLANSINPNAPILGFSAPDPRTIVVKIKEPVNYLISILTPGQTGGFIFVPKETDGSFDIKKDMIGTGAFMLSSWTPSVGFTMKRNPDYYDKELPYVDQVELPVVAEYAQQIAQFKAGNTYTSSAFPAVTYGIRGEDVLGLKRDNAALQLYQTEPAGFVSGATVGFGWLPAGKSPFNDERVRQALSMSYDRDAFIDVFYNVGKFQSQGLPVNTVWFTFLGPGPGWTLDPRDKEFGPNAKFFKQDIAEAKKLMEAAGYGSGLDVVSSYIAGPQLGATFQRQVEVREEMARQVGFRPTANLVDYALEYLPKYRDSNGKYEGWSYRIGVAPAASAVSYLDWRFNSKSGPGFLGFDAGGKGDGSGDPQVDANILKARGEFDTEKRRAIVYDLQRYLAQKMYCVSSPGASSSFEVTWPAMRNYLAFQGDRRSPAFTWWLDDQQAPLKRA